MTPHFLLYRMPDGALVLEAIEQGERFTLVVGPEHVMLGHGADEGILVQHLNNWLTSNEEISEALAKFQKVINENQRDEHEQI